jgi:hypothetical protein
MPEQHSHTKPAAADLPGADCRAHERHPCEVHGSCRPLSTFAQADDRWPATITNISLGGLCVRVSRRFERGASLAIGLGGPSGGEGGLIFARVVHARPAADGGWNLGCQFVTELTEDELFRLLDASTLTASARGGALPVVQSVAPSQLLGEQGPAAAHGAGQRVHGRHAPTEPSILSLAIRPTFGGKPAVLADASASGIGLILDRPLEEGTVLAIDMRGPDGEGARRVARVRNCRPCPAPADAPWLTPVPVVTRLARLLFGTKPPPPPGAWMIGCQFARPLDDGELNELLGLLPQGRG